MTDFKEPPMATERIFIVDDETTIAKLLELWVGQRWGYRVEVFSEGKTFRERMSDPPDLVLLDLMLPDVSGVDLLKEIKHDFPDLPVIILSAQSKIEVALETMKLGAADYFSKPVDFPKLEIAIKNALRLASLTREVQRLRENVENRVHFDNIVAQSGEMQEVFRLVNKVKNSDICVLILGESGTGKELIARAIHFNSAHAKAPFVVVNCASIPHDLLESELFGHEKGSFTGAMQRRIGKFEQAIGGTIFLDEIGELDLSLQSKILRVIQEKTFTRVGGNETITTDARLISATNRDLREEVKQRNFREDLYFRLSTFPIMLPPLRQRKSDILLLADHFLKRFASEQGKPNLRFTRKALDMIYRYPWPGNTRELENAIQRAVVLVDGDTLSEQELPVAVLSYASSEEGVESQSLFSEGTNDKKLSFSSPDGTSILSFEKIKEEAIRYALKATDGNIAEAAKRLEIGRATLYRLAEKYKIKI
jgi:DNA-binding NtrC family response regulator